MTDPQKFAAMKKEIFLDAGLLLLGLHVFIASMRQRKTTVGA